jgi:hypothetical protein
VAIKKFTSKTRTSKVSNFLVQYLIVGGGGGSKSPTGCCTGTGGSGAGGFVEGTYNALRGVTYTVVVGAGGSAGRGNSSSVFGITAAGGGTGTAWQNIYVGDGGSGGGAGYDKYDFVGLGIPGQGNNGGLDDNIPPQAGGGGGGGAGAVGATGATSGKTTGADGGIGKQSSITGTATYYAGGGGAAVRANWGQAGGTGGAGGLGGGGKGSDHNSDNAVNGTSNTGGGSGGAYGQSGGTSKSGGSGVVIVKAGIAASSTTGSPSNPSFGIYIFNGDGSITF